MRQYSRRDSNPHHAPVRRSQFIKLPLYPLSYGSIVNRDESGGGRTRIARFKRPLPSQLGHRLRVSEK